MKSIVPLPRLALAASCLLFAFAGCSSLCDLRNPQTGRPIPAQFNGTSGTVARNHPLPRPALLVDVDHDQCAGFERFVFEFEGGIPGYKIRYVDRPIRDCGAGNVIPVAGDAWLKMHFMPAQAHELDGSAATISDRNRMLDYSNARQLVDVCDFEGNVEWVLGVGYPGRFRVTELQNPPRVVVDVKTR